MNPDSPTPPETTRPPTPPRAKINWPLFYGLLLTPATLLILAIACNFLGGVVFITIYGSPMAGLACAMMYSESISGSTALRISAFFLLWPLFTMVSFGLCFFGCAIGGVK